MERKTRDSMKMLSSKENKGKTVKGEKEDFWRVITNVSIFCVQRTYQVRNFGGLK
jgi:hypothetical protein